MRLAISEKHWNCGISGIAVVSSIAIVAPISGIAQHYSEMQKDW